MAAILPEMWPFKRRPVLPLDQAIEQAVPFTAEAWRRFRETNCLPANLHLRDQIAFFARDFVPELERGFPALRNAPNELVLLIIALAIEAAGHAPRQKIERHLGIVLPQSA